MPKVVLTHEHDFRTRSLFTMRKHGGWEKATVGWLRGQEPYKSDPSKLYVEVTCHTDSHSPRNPAFTQRFTGDAAGLAGARSYAKRLVKAGDAVASYVTIYAWAYSDRSKGMDFIVVRSESYGPEETLQL